MTRPVRPNAPRARDPYGIGPVSNWIAPVLSAVGLILIGIVTFNLLRGDLPIVDAYAGLYEMSPDSHGIIG